MQVRSLLQPRSDVQQVGGQSQGDMSVSISMVTLPTCDCFSIVLIRKLYMVIQQESHIFNRAEETIIHICYSP